MKIVDLITYPIKSLPGIHLSQSYFTPEGLQYDRRWVLIDENNQFISLRQYTTLTQLNLELRKNGLIIQDISQKLPLLTVELNQLLSEQIEVSIWDDLTIAFTGNKLYDHWFSQFLSTPVRLAHLPAISERVINEKYTTSSEKVSFADSMPILLTTEASLEDLNARLDVTVEANRFRPNIIITSSQPWEEDTWRSYEINNATFRVTKSCPRCIVVNLDPVSGESSKEPLATLSMFRKAENKILFGQYAIPTGSGKLSIGDTLTVNYNL